MDDTAELNALFRQLRDKLQAWNTQHGHPFEGTSDGPHEAIRSELMPACRAFANRDDLIAALPKRRVLAEVGNFFGHLSVKILELNEPREFHTFDWNLDTITAENRAIMESYGRCFYYEGDPFSNARHIEPGTFDIVYLNKSKDYGTVQRELDCWLHLLAPDGVLVVNDFTAWDPVQGIPYGVLSAVSRFVNANGLEVIYLSIQDQGFFNIAVRRP